MSELPASSEKLEDAFFRSLFESDIAGLAVTDLRTQTVIEANDRLLQILDRTWAEIVGVPAAWTALTPAEYQPLDTAAMEAVRAGRPSPPFTKEYLRPDGSRLTARVTISLVRGHPEKVIVAVTDITAERRREMEIRNNDEQLGMLADSLPALISYIDRDLNYLFVNKPYEEWLGVPRREIVGRNVRDFLADDHLQTRERAFAGVLTGTPQKFEAQMPYREGARLTEVQYIPRFDTGGTVTGFYVLVQDISERKKIEEELRRTIVALTESEARFRAMAEAAPVMIWQSGPTGENEYLNSAYLRFFGKTAEEMRDFGWIAAKHPDEKDRNMDEYFAALRERRPFETESRYLDADGRYRVLHSVGVPRVDPDGTYAGHIGISRDVTEEREAEAKQKLLIDELNHRVKNTLAVVQSVARQTLRGETIPADVRTSFEQRLMALATAHDVLTRKNWNPASIEVVFRTVLEALSIPENRMAISGPLFRVPPKTAVSLAMAAHELATNALKYGSLSVAQGKVSIDWRIADGRFELVWRELDGPPVAEPEHRGFGTRLLERGLAAEFGGAATLDFNPAGLICSIAAPLPQGAYVIV